MYVSIPTVASGASTGAGIKALLAYNSGFNATDSAGNASTSIGTADLQSYSTTGKGIAYVRKSIPTLSAVALPTTVLAAGSQKVLGRVQISADAAGDVSWDKLVFTVSKNSALTIGGTSTIALWNGANSVGGTFATTTVDALAGGTGDALSGYTSGTLQFFPNSEQQIPAGTSVTYELRGTIGGIASGANNIDVSIANPSVSITTSDSSTVGVAANTTGAPSLTWSDRSSISTVHSLSTQDWTNDYLVKTLPLDLGTQ